MSEAFIIYLSSRGRDENGERIECVVAVCWLVDLATKWLSCARKHTTKTNSNRQSSLPNINSFILFLLRDSCDIIFLVKFNVELIRQAMDFPTKLFLFPSCQLYLYF